MVHFIVSLVKTKEMVSKGLGTLQVVLWYLVVLY